MVGVFLFVLTHSELLSSSGARSSRNLCLLALLPGLELHRILDICIQAVAHGQDIREYRKLKRDVERQCLLCQLLINALIVKVKCLLHISGNATYPGARGENAVSWNYSI